ncbi:MAG: hypothetical protein ICV74_02965 [Thermoleophilia bacterium]|nr:hypothetical protein [Thermoleophilia bacterium]
MIVGEAHDPAERAQALRAKRERVHAEWPQTDWKATVIRAMDELIAEYEAASED